MRVIKVGILGILFTFSLAFAKGPGPSGSKKTRRQDPLKIEGRVKKPELVLESPEKIEGDGNYMDPYDHWELKSLAESSR